MPYVDFEAVMTLLRSIDARLAKIEPKETPHEYKQLGELMAIFCPHCGEIKKVA